jgi:hypothetical protein
MDPVTFSLGVASGLIVGGVGGWFGHVLTIRRTKQDRRLEDTLAALDLCVDVFNARVAFVLAAAFGGRDLIRTEKQEYMDLWHKHWRARPEDLVPPSTWEVWMEAEDAAKSKDTPWEDRTRDLQKQIKNAQITVLDWLKDERARLLK